MLTSGKEKNVSGDSDTTGCGGVTRPGQLKIKIRAQPYLND